MQTKFVVRLLDADGELLAWATVWAFPKPQPRDKAASCPFWPLAETVFHVERAGLASKISVHWCDLDIARIQGIATPTMVDVGQSLKFTWLEPVWLVAGMRDVPLPTVTERATVAITVPTGGLGLTS